MTDQTAAKGNKQYRSILPKTSEITIKLENPTTDFLTTKKPRLYACCECDEVFVRFANLVKHELQHVGKQKNQEIHICELCLSLNQSAEALREHVTSMHTNDRHLCLLCLKNYKSRRYLLRHVQEVHKQTTLMFYCKICSEMPQFSTRSMLIEHFQTQHTFKGQQQSIETITPDEMTEEFLDEFLLNNDSSFAFTEWETLGDLKLTDMLLNETASTNATTLKQTSYQCPQKECMENCEDLKDFFSHLEEWHKIDFCTNNSFPCPYCNRQHKRMSYLRQHLRVRHAIWKKHVCQICDKQFASMDHLRKHVLSIHHNERRYACKYCHKTYTQLSHLKEHLAKHTTGKQVRC